MKRQVFRYTVKVDAQPHTFDLTGDPLHVANGATLADVEFWAECDADAADLPRRSRSSVPAAAPRRRGVRRDLSMYPPGAGLASVPAAARP